MTNKKTDNLCLPPEDLALVGIRCCLIVVALLLVVAEFQALH